MSSVGESSAVRWRLSTVQAVLVSTVVALSVPLVVPVFGGSGQAAATVGFVLAEALVLYVGYGALIRVVSPTTREVLAGL